MYDVAFSFFTRCVRFAHSRWWALCAMTFLLVFLAGSLGFGARAKAETQVPIAAGTKVRILHNNAPPVRFTALAKDDKPVDPLSCLSKEELQEKYGNDKNAYRAALERKAKCAQNIADAAALAERIAETDAALAATRKFIRALETTKKELAGKTTLDGLRLAAVPIGGLVEREYPTVKRVAMQCIQSRSQKTVAERETAVGTSVTEKANGFSAVTPEQTQKILNLKTEAENVQKAYDGLAADYAANNGDGSFFQATWARAVKIALNIRSLLNSSRGDFVLLTPAAVREQFPSLKPDERFDFFFRLTPQRPIAIPSLKKIIQDHGGIPEGAEFTIGTVSIGGTVFTGLPLPEAHTLDGFRKGVAVLITNFTTGEFFVFDDKTKEFVPDKKKKNELFVLSERVLLEERRVLQEKIDALARDNYGCDAAAPAGSGAAIIRFPDELHTPSGAPADAPTEELARSFERTEPDLSRVAASETGRREEVPVSSRTQIEPSYLIIESFDDPSTAEDESWGEIVEILEDESAEEVTRPDLVENRVETEQGPQKPSLWERVRESVLGIIGRLTGSSVPSANREPTNVVFETEPGKTASSADGAGLNLIVTKPVISGSSAGADALFAGEMTLRADIVRSGSGAIGVFENTLQYAAGDGSFQDWVKFELSGLGEGEKGFVSYRWKGGPGVWRFRVRADSGQAISESDEGDNYSEPVRVEIVENPAAEVEITTLPIQTGPSRVTLSAPQFKGAPASEGTFLPGEMMLSEKLTNEGGALSGTLNGVWQYATGAVFTDWIHVLLPALGPGATAESSYAWKGGRGMWRFRFCLEDGLAGASRSCSDAIFVEII